MWINYLIDIPNLWLFSCDFLICGLFLPWFGQYVVMTLLLQNGTKG